MIDNSEIISILNKYRSKYALVNSRDDKAIEEAIEIIAENIPTNECFEDADDEDTTTYRLTPKACALLALQEAEYKSDFTEDIQFKLFWKTFEDLMIKQGNVIE